MKLSDIKANPDNPRVIKDEAFNKLVQSIKDFPKMMALRPMVVDDNLTVLGGNMRLRALRHLGYKDIPDEWVKRASDLTEEEQKQFIIKDNVSVGDWDWDTLANEWDVQDLKDWGLEMPADWGVERVEAKEDDYEIPDEIETDIVEGDIFDIGQHRLLCGSSTQTDTWKRLMGDELADLVITDPPYNVAYTGGTKDALTMKNDSMADGDFYQFLYDFYTALGSYTKAGGAWYVWHADSGGANFRRAMADAGIMVKQCLIWVKNSMVMGRQDYQWKHEPCLYGWKPGAAHYFTDDRTKTTVIEDKIDPKKLKKDELLKIVEEMFSEKTSTTILRADKPLKNDLHPTMKPILLLAPLIQNSSKNDEIVADGFLGSGSTMVASHQLNRKCYGIEISPKYCQVIIDRMRNLDKELKIFKNGVPWQEKTKTGKEQ